MDVIWTILIILGAILAAPFVALGYLVIIFGAILAFIFFIIVVMMGVEPSTPVFITCMVAGVVVVIATGVGNELEEKKNKKDK